MFGTFRLAQAFVIATLAMLFIVELAQAQPKLEKDSPEIVVAALYHDYAWEVILLNSKYVELVDLPRKELEKYFSPTLAQLLIQDRECKETNDVCGMDFDPIYASQDRSFVRDLEIRATSKKNEIKVRFKNTGSPSAVELTYRVIESASGWRIDDIDYGAGKSTLRSILKNEH